MKVIHIIFLAAICEFGHADELKSFVSDGCSVFPDGTIEQSRLWLSCCVKHDLAYWKGGSSAEREIADRELKQCVRSVGEKEIAELMLAGVRVGVSPYFPTEFRWGYGWPYLRGYEPISDEEMKQVKARLLEYETKKLNIN